MSVRIGAYVEVFIERLKELSHIFDGSVEGVPPPM